MSNAPTPRAPWWALLSIAALVTALNAVKPCHGDDQAYLEYARAFAEHPLRPYDFKYSLPPFQFDGMTVLVPPVVPYWLALGIRLVGNDPIWLRLWLLPFLALFVWAGYTLGRRAGCPFPALLTGALLCSPGLLPGINCMLDVPALALVLATVAVQWRAARRGSWGLALCAAVLAGLAMQTKYTAFVTVPLLALAGILNRRWLLGVMAALVALGLFVGWECFLVTTQGQSHFMVALGLRSSGPGFRMLRLLLPTLTQIGALAAGFASMALVALGRPRLALLPLGLALVAVPLLALLPESWVFWVQAKHSWNGGFGLGHVLHGAAGATAVLASGLMVWRLLREDASPLGRFLLVWLALEVAALFVLSPFPAARRYIGTVAVLALLVGRLAGRFSLSDNSLVPYRWAAAATVLLGLTYFTADFAEAWGLYCSARQAVGRAAEVADGGQTWSFGWIGFEYYAERAGARPFNCMKPPRKGDVLVVLDHEFTRLPIQQLPTSELEKIEEVPVPCPLPVGTGTGYYGGRLPLGRLLGPPRRALLYRVKGPLKYPG
jgi:hypothetical protein